MFKSAILNKKTVRLACALLALVFVIAAFISPGAKATINYSNYMVRVGLRSAYTSDSVYSAALRLDSIGILAYGFKMGYYNDNRNFIELYDLDNETSITVIRSYNYNINTDSYVSDGADTTYVVGAYHLELNITFANQTELDAAVAIVKQTTNYYTYPAFTRNGYRVRIGRYSSTDAALADMATVLERLQSVYSAADLAVVGKGTNAYTVIRSGSRNILYEFDGATKQLGVVPYGNGDDTEVWFGSYSYNGGYDFAKTTTTTFSVVNVVDLPHYVKGVVPYELGGSSYWPMETLKAHAVCAATFAVANKERHKSYGFDVCTGQHCQVYRGTTSATDRTDEAVGAVAGVIITYNGVAIDAVYHSSNGGYTENSENVWVATVPYLRAVEDEYETLVYAYHGYWTTTITGTQIAAKLNAYNPNYNIGTVVDVWVSQRTVPGDNVYSLSFGDASGNRVTLYKENMRMVLGTSILFSQRFEVVTSGKVFLNESGDNISGLTGAYAITASGSTVLTSASRSIITSEGVQDLSIGSTGTFIFEGTGWGHSLGLSQFGSKGMAEAGFTYDQILKHYFTGVELVTHD